MRRVAKFFALPPADRALLMRALAPLAAMRGSLWIAPYARVREIANSMSAPRRSRPHGQRPAREKVAWAVCTAARIVPGAGNCLVRALATEILLKRFGYPSELKIGVTRPVDGPLEAHAWLESEGHVVIGDFQLDRYVPLGARDPVVR